MKFTFDIVEPQRQYIQITAEIAVNKAETKVFFPAWRPGRYELGDFAKNVNYFQVTDAKGEALSYEKLNKNTWLVQTDKIDAIVVKYSYYATDLNAGSTYLDDKQLYVNPVNCCLFTDETFDQPITVQLNVPTDWKVAHSLKVEDNSFTVKNYDQLADCPFICSPDLQHQSYVVEGVKFHVWMNGIVQPDWPRLLKDFELFTKAQIEKYGVFPTDEYHFLFHILPYKIYHGVEHSKSTVIALGPSYMIFEELYKELLGVSSHELYHTWNIKAIRPVEMFPYDFKKENYSRLGYIAEGVTTYMGDLMLLKSGVFTLPQYLNEMNTQLHKHYHNFGRKNYSVADSSFDTWLDGYVPGAPNRKVSIYTEGCLISFIIDINLMKHSNNTYSLDDVMKSLYHNYAAKGKGITEAIYQAEIEKLMGTSVQWLFDDYVNGTKDYTPLLEECYAYLGLTLRTTPTDSVMAAYFGGKITGGEQTKIAALYPEGPLDKAGAMLGDQLVAINAIQIADNADRWVNYFLKEEMTLTIIRQGRIMQLKLAPADGVYYCDYALTKREDITPEQEAALNKWSS